MSNIQKSNLIKFKILGVSYISRELQMIEKSYWYSNTDQGIHVIAFCIMALNFGIKAIKVTRMGFFSVLALKPF